MSWALPALYPTLRFASLITSFILFLEHFWYFFVAVSPLPPSHLPQTADPSSLSQPVPTPFWHYLALHIVRTHHAHIMSSFLSQISHLVNFRHTCDPHSKSWAVIWFLHSDCAFWDSLKKISSPCWLAVRFPLLLTHLHQLDHCPFPKCYFTVHTFLFSRLLGYLQKNNPCFAIAVLGSESHSASLFAAVWSWPH